MPYIVTLQQVGGLMIISWRTYVQHFAYLRFIHYAYTHAHKYIQVEVCYQSARAILKYFGIHRYEYTYRWYLHIHTVGALLEKPLGHNIGIFSKSALQEVCTNISR